MPTTMILIEQLESRLINLQMDAWKVENMDMLLQEKGRIGEIRYIITLISRLGGGIDT